MNAGTATYVNYRIMCAATSRAAGRTAKISSNSKSHTNVVFQPEFDDQRFSGFSILLPRLCMMKDIARIVSNPDARTESGFREIAGKGDVMGVLRDVWANYAMRGHSQF